MYGAVSLSLYSDGPYACGANTSFDGSLSKGTGLSIIGRASVKLPPQHVSGLPGAFWRAAPCTKMRSRGQLSRTALPMRPAAVPQSLVAPVFQRACEGSLKRSVPGTHATVVRRAMSGTSCLHTSTKNVPLIAEMPATSPQSDSTCDIGSPALLSNHQPSQPLGHSSWTPFK